MMLSNVTDNNGPWNSLETAKVVVSSIAPFALAFCGYVIGDAQRVIVEQREIALKGEQKATDARSKADENLRQLRTAVYNDAAPLIREVLTYHFHVGNWKELPPAEPIKIRRKPDSFVYGRDASLSDVRKPVSQLHEGGLRRSGKLAR